MNPKTKLLIFHIGSLGDTLMAVPALWVIHDTFPDAYRVLLTKRTVSHSLSVIGHQLFEGTSLFHDVIIYPGERYLDKRIRRFFDFLLLFFRLRIGRFDGLVYLVPSSRSVEQVDRDKRFFRWCGIKTLIGFDHNAFPPATSTLPPLPMQAREAEMLLKRLALSGLPSIDLCNARLDLDLNAIDEKIVDGWLSKQNTDDGKRPWIAFAAGSNMAAKKWPGERFIQVGKRLITEFDIWPVFFGGSEDAPLGDEFIAAWGRGYNAAGFLSPRSAALALGRCHLFIGNDTGTMHLAASAGVSCVAIFSARDFPGKWYPIGGNHTVIRKQLACEGCMLEICTDRGNECLNQISVEEVLQAATSHLHVSLGEISHA